MSESLRHPAPSGRPFARFAPVAAVIALVGGALGLFGTPAGASSSMTITASGATNVGLQIFANVNVFGSNSGGTVVFKLYGPGNSSCSGGAAWSATATVSGQSTTSPHYTTTQAGTYRWQASYSGPGGTAGPTSCSDPSASVDVSPVRTGLSVSATAPASGTVHASASLGGYSPTGTITFLLTPPGDTFCSTTPVFSSTVAVHGSGTYSSGSYAPTATGSYKWRAIYGGDANNYRDATQCLDPDAAVTVGSVRAVPPPVIVPATSAPAAAKPATPASPAPSAPTSVAAAASAGAAATTTTVPSATTLVPPGQPGEPDAAKAASPAGPVLSGSPTGWYHATAFTAPGAGSVNPLLPVGVVAAAVAVLALALYGRRSWNRSRLPRWD